MPLDPEAKALFDFLGITARKLEAMHCYRTQFSALSYGARGLLDDPEVYRYEVRWELEQP